jgi:hypothetical protein
MSTEKEQLDYGEMLRVLGLFIQQERLTDISILEYEGGWIVHGLTFETTGTSFMRANRDYVLSHDDLAKLHDQFKRQRKESQQATKSRWLR